MNGLLLLTLCSLSFLSGLASKCNSANEGQEVVDKCGRACYCENGRLVDCCRIRKDFTSMTGAERARYIRTIKKARTDRRYKRQFRRIVTKHSKLFMTGIHSLSQFLPWHRYFLLEWEDLLQKIDCRVTLPYHDWSLFSGRPWKTTRFWRGRPRNINEGFWSSSPRGFGGDGKGSCVRTGQFTRGRWSIPRKSRGQRKQCIKREFHGRPAGIVAVQRLLRNHYTHFKRFELQLRAELHDGFHCNVGGTMCGVNSASAPEFFLHHCFIDKLWANWQELGDRYMDAYFVRHNKPLIGSQHRRRGSSRTLKYYTKNFVDNTYMTRRRKRPQCVLYDDPKHPEYERIIDRLDQMRSSELRRIPRHSFTPPTNRQLRRLGVNRRDRRWARRLVRELQPARPMRTERGMNAEDRALGFQMGILNSWPRRGKRMAPFKENAMWDRWRRRHRNSTTEFPYHFHANTTFSEP